MPMLYAYMPDGALKPTAEHKLLDSCTDLLLKYEGVGPGNEGAQSGAVNPQMVLAG